MPANAPWLHIRPAVTDDVIILHDLYTRHLASRPQEQPQDLSLWSKLLGELIERPDFHILIGETEKHIIGTVTLTLVPNLTHNLKPYAVIENLVTHRDFRNMGYATMLVRKACRMAKEHDCYKIMLMTGSRKDAERRFYKRCGFKSSEKGAFLKYF